MKKRSEGDLKSILIVCHPDFVPTRKKNKKKAKLWKTEWDVFRHLREDGHRVDLLGIDKTLRPLEAVLSNESYEIVFNLLEEFSGNPKFECILPSYLDAKKIPYTGCSAMALLACRMKGTTKWLLRHQGILTPNFLVLDQHRRQKRALSSFEYPAIVKLADEDASLGIVKNSVVKNPKQAESACRRLRDTFGGRIIVEQFIEGREFHLTIFWRGGRIEVLHPLETVFGKVKGVADSIATEKVKWNSKYRRQNRIVTRQVHPSHAVLIRRLKRLAAKVGQALFVDAYARIDVRMDARGRIYVIDVNPNPDIGEGYEVADSFKRVGISYKEMLRLIVAQGDAQARGSSENLEK